MRVEIRISGTGGQGVILAGIILADALGVYEERMVVQTQSYGPEARGGASKVDIIVSDKPIFYPQTQSLDILACLSQKSLDEYLAELKPGGTLIIDSYYCQNCFYHNTKPIPFSLIAKEKLGRELFANIILLGSIARITNLVKLDSLKKSLAHRVPSHLLELNIKALNLGYEIAT